MATTRHSTSLAEADLAKAVMCLLDALSFCSFRNPTHHSNRPSSIGMSRFNTSKFDVIAILNTGTRLLCWTCHLEVHEMNSALAVVSSLAWALGPGVTRDHERVRVKTFASASDRRCCNSSWASSWRHGQKPANAHKYNTPRPRPARFVMKHQVLTPSRLPTPLPVQQAYTSDSRAAIIRAPARTTNLR